MLWALTFWDRPGTIFKWKLCLCRVVELSIKSSRNTTTTTTPPAITLHPSLPKSDPCLAASLPLTHVCLPTCLALQRKSRTFFFSPAGSLCKIWVCLMYRWEKVDRAWIRGEKSCAVRGFELFCSTLVPLCYLIPVSPFDITIQSIHFQPNLSAGQATRPLNAIVRPPAWSTSLPLLSSALLSTSLRGCELAARSCPCLAPKQEHCQS